jgi:MoaA/NifB/PqqE/SkfB family radical SAM enzyme
MRLFNSIALEITARCNRTCKWCPVAYNSRPDERMDYKLLHKALLELRALNYRGRVEFYIYNEPCQQMDYLLDSLQQARLAVPRATLMLATNGDYLRGRDSILKLYDAGLNQLLINCYSPGLYQRRLAWISGLPVHISRTKGVYSTMPHGCTVQMLDKSDPTTFGKGVFALANRAGNIVPFIAPVGQPLVRMCTKPFRFFNINWKGQALLCCQDYHGQIEIGNLRDNTLVQLWNHPVMNTYRKHLYKKDRTLPLCSKCDCNAGAYPANVEKPHGPYVKLRG